MRFVETSNSRPMKLAQAMRKRHRIACLCRKLGIELAFLHGSLASDRHGAMSDVDIAIYSPGIDTDRLLKFQRELEGITGRDDVDVALLHRASSVLGMQVITRGIPLYVRDRTILQRFRFETFTRYLDGQCLRRRFAEYVMEACL